jgi:hypothetical protein
MMGFLVALVSVVFASVTVRNFSIPVSGNDGIFTRWGSSDGKEGLIATWRHDPDNGDSFFQSFVLTSTLKAVPLNASFWSAPQGVWFAPPLWSTNSSVLLSMVAPNASCSCDWPTGNVIFQAADVLEGSLYSVELAPLDGDSFFNSQLSFFSSVTNTLYMIRRDSLSFSRVVAWAGTAFVDTSTPPLLSNLDYPFWVYIAHPSLAYAAFVSQPLQSDALPLVLHWVDLTEWTIVKSISLDITCGPRPLITVSENAIHLLVQTMDGTFVSVRLSLPKFEISTTFIASSTPMLSFKPRLIAADDMAVFSVVAVEDSSDYRPYSWLLRVSANGQVSTSKVYITIESLTLSGRFVYLQGGDFSTIYPVYLIQQYEFDMSLKGGGGEGRSMTGLAKRFAFPPHLSASHGLRQRRLIPTGNLFASVPTSFSTMSLFSVAVATGAAGPFCNLDAITQKHGNIVNDVSSFIPSRHELVLGLVDAMALLFVNIDNCTFRVVNITGIPMNNWSEFADVFVQSEESLAIFISFSSEADGRIRVAEVNPSSGVASPLQTLNFLSQSQSVQIQYFDQEVFWTNLFCEWESNRCAYISFDWIRGTQFWNVSGNAWIDQQRDAWPLAKTSRGTYLSIMPVSTSDFCSADLLIWNFTGGTARFRHAVQGCYKSFMDNPIEGFQSVYDADSDTFSFIFPHEAGYSFSQLQTVDPTTGAPLQTISTQFASVYSAWTFVPNKTQ